MKRVPDVELIMAEAPVIRVKNVKERKVRDKGREKGKRRDAGSKGQRSINPRRR